MKRIVYFIPFVFFISCKHRVIIHPQIKDIIETVYASGKIIADKEYFVYALSPGTIIKKLVKEGDLVKEGQIIFIIRHDAPQSKLDAARTNYEVAQSNLSERSAILNDLKLNEVIAQTKLSNDSLQYVRLKNLWEEGIGTKNGLDNSYTSYTTSRNQKKSAEEKYYAALNDLKVSLQNAKSQVSTAQNDLNNFIIKSESDGTVYQTFKEEGETVKMNDVLALLGKSSRRIIKLAIDQQDVGKVKQGQLVLLKTDVTGNVIYHASIIRIYPTMSETDQTFRADAVFEDTSQQSYIHSSVEANIVIQIKKNALVVPSEIFTSADRLQVKQNGEIKTILVRTGIHTMNEVEVLDGLTESSQIIVPQK